MSLPRPRRVVSSSEFRNTYKSGFRTTCRYFVAFYLRKPASSDCGRVGFTIPRAVGKATVRNRVRRRMREACRIQLAALAEGCVVIFNPRRNAADAEFEDLCCEVAKVFAKCAQSSSRS